jgi:hypothetical protein
MVRVPVINPPHNQQPQAQANIAAGSYQGYPQPQAEPDMSHGRGSQVDMSEYSSWVSLWPLG